MSKAKSQPELTIELSMGIKLTNVISGIKQIFI